MSNHKLFRKAVVLVTMAWATTAGAVQDGQLAPPNVQTVDGLGVNVATGQVSQTLQTVSIGGDMGLSHSISLFTNHIPYESNYGYTDKYAGGAKLATIGRFNEATGQYFNYKGQSYSTFTVMRVFGPVGSEDFEVHKNGVLQSNPQGLTGVTYVAMGDERNKLENVTSGTYTNHLKWTTPDGTEVYYDGNEIRAIVYPNGYTIKILGLGSVTTNTGFQLRYERPVITAGLSAEKVQIKASMHPDAEIKEINPSSWSSRNPKYVIGLNNAIEYCSSAHTRTPCSLTNDWPTATFTWPGGMPQAIYLGDSIFSVEDATGGVTEFHYQSQDPTVDGVLGGTDPYLSGIKFSPRLVGIKSAGSTAIDFEYEYENIGSYRSERGSLNTFTYWQMSNEAGEIKSAEGPNGKFGYTIGQPIAQMPAPVENFGSGPGVAPRIMVQLRNEPYGKLAFLVVNRQNPTTYEEKYTFEGNYRNFVTNYVSSKSAGKSYDYSGPRGNLIKVSTMGGNITAIYPSTCSTSERKRCNKPTSVTDAKGNTTNYEYHQASGQVTKVTEPADSFGRRSQTRYSYEQKYAYYYVNSGSSIERAATPIWMLTRKEYCQTSAASGDGCGVAGDEVVTTYDYSSPYNNTATNLLLRSETTSADGKSRTTCYQYDIYGNRIGTTQPLGVGGGPTSCP